MDDFGGLIFIGIIIGLIVLILYAIAAVFGIAVVVAAIYGFIRTIINYVTAFNDVMKARKATNS